MDHRFIKGALSPNAHPQQQVALARIAEEAAEIVKEAMKALRFGPANRYPDPGPTNAEKIVSEFHDLTAAVIDAFGIEPLLRIDPSADPQRARLVVDAPMVAELRELLSTIISAHLNGLPGKDEDDDRIFMDGAWLSDAQRLLARLGGES